MRNELQTRRSGCDRENNAKKRWGFLIGKIVRVTDFYMANGVPTWKIEGDRIISTCGMYFLVGVWDSELRPIRNDPGTDETLTWTPVPSKLKEKA